MDNDYIPSGAAEAEDVEEIVEELEEELDEDEEQDNKETSAFTNPVDILMKYHPECILDYEEDEQTDVPLQSTLSEDDKLHRSPPFLTIYERTKILGMRTNQLAQGARPYIVVPEHITDVQDIAKLEIEQRKLPLIIKRHMPDGSYEKFRLSDLIIL